MAKTWQRKRGNANGRNGSIGRLYPAWRCAGCGRDHGGTVPRTRALDGLDYCNATYSPRALLPYLDNEPDVSISEARNDRAARRLTDDL